MKRTSVSVAARSLDAVAPQRTAPAAAPVPLPAPAPAPGPVEALRARLAGQSAREHVVLDFLEDDLREARAALAAVAAYLANVELALDGPVPSPDQLLALAQGRWPAERLDDLATMLASVRRRIAQVAARM